MLAHPPSRPNLDTYFDLCENGKNRAKIGQNRPKSKVLISEDAGTEPVRAGGDGEEYQGEFI